MPYLEDVEQVFFDAMINGWAAGAPKTPVPGFPGAKGIEYRRNGFRVLDYYLITGEESPNSAGSTIIWHEDRPIWMMQYGGQYFTALDEGVTALLKRALMDAYRRRHFSGGRGISGYHEGALRYINNVHLNNFRNFCGIEEIFDTKNNLCLGYHRYHGLLLA